MELDLNRLAEMGPHLILSVNGPVLTEAGRILLETVQPFGLILFADNIETEDQLKQLATDIRAVHPHVQFMVDFEGGVVNRFKALTGPVAAPADQSDLKAFGRWSGELLSRFDIAVNFAPVVDLDRGNRGNGLDGRYLGNRPEIIVKHAGQYLSGLESTGVTGCIKHYPGLGPTTPDSHFGLPELTGIDPEDELPFRQLAAPGRWIMCAHVRIAGYPEISTYSPQLISRIRFFHGGPGFVNVAAFGEGHEFVNPDNDLFPFTEGLSSFQPFTQG